MSDHQLRKSVYAAAARTIFTAVLAAAFFHALCFTSDAHAAGSVKEEMQTEKLQEEKPQEEKLQEEKLQEESRDPEDQQQGLLILEDPGDKTRYAEYEMSVGDSFSIEFIHSVNKSPVTDYFEIREDGIYGVKTVYYGFGAGVPSELEEGQTLTYGEDGSMILTGYEVKLSNLIYRAGTVYDHILTLPDGTQISLRDLCGRSARVGFRFEQE